MNPEFFRYPSGYMNILALVYKISNYSKRNLTIEYYYNVAWLFSRLCIAGIAAVVFIICSININYIFGILGSFLTVFSTIIYTNANYAILDVPMTLFVALFFLVLTVLYSKNDWNIRNLVLLASIAGIATAIKYTAALLIPTLLFLSTQYVDKYKIYVFPFKIIKKLLVFFGIIFLIVPVIIKFNHKSFLDYFRFLTTDGIIEIEYIYYFNIFLLLIGIIGIVCIALGIYGKSDQINLVGYILSPFTLFILSIPVISFALMSPYTFIELKRSFANFMYEYRHMNIGSAAHYHHLSNEYKTIISNSSSLSSVIFYIQLIDKNLGFLNIVFCLYGVYSLYLQKPQYTTAMIIYIVIVFLILFSWKNVADRYILNIFPLIIIFVIHGLYEIYHLIKQRFSFNKLLLIGIMSISLFTHQFINIFKTWGIF